MLLMSDMCIEHVESLPDIRWLQVLSLLLSLKKALNKKGRVPLKAHL